MGLVFNLLDMRLIGLKDFHQEITRVVDESLKHSREKKGERGGLWLMLDMLLSQATGFEKVKLWSGYVGVGSLNIDHNW